MKPILSVVAILFVCTTLSGVAIKKTTPHEPILKKTAKLINTIKDEYFSDSPDISLLKKLYNQLGCIPLRIARKSQSKQNPFAYSIIIWKNRLKKEYNL